MIKEATVPSDDERFGRAGLEEYARFRLCSPMIKSKVSIKRWIMRIVTFVSVKLQKN